MTLNMISIAAASVALSASVAMAADLGPLVTPIELSTALEETEGAPVLLDIRGDAYSTGHIEGAVSAPYSLFRGPADNPGQIVPVETLEDTYENLGLTLDQPVVIVTDGKTDSDFGAAARVYWTLKSSGFEQLSILNGGELAWVNAGLPVSTDAVEPVPTELSITWDNSWTAETDDVQNVVSGTADALLLDARPAAFFEGKQAHAAAARPGTLPGAKDYPYTNFFRPDASAISAVSYTPEMKETLGLSDGQDVISFCNTGHWAATNWFALSELAQLDQVKLYPGSMVEYSNMGGEMANAPGLIENLFNQFRGGN